MRSEVLDAVKTRLKAMKKIEATGFTDEAKAKAYFEEKELILEDIVKAVEEAVAAQNAETEALKETVKSLRGELKTQATYPRELPRR